MKHILFLSLWGATALGSRCKPDTSGYIPGTQVSESTSSGVESGESSSTTAGNSGYYPPPGGSSSGSSTLVFTYSRSTGVSGSTAGTGSYSSFWTSSASSYWTPGETPQSSTTDSGESSVTTPGQPGNTDTSVIPGNSDTTPGQPSNTDTAGQPGGTNTTPGQPGNTDTATIPGGTNTTPGVPGNTDTAGQPGGTNTTPGLPGNTDTAGQPTSTDSAGQPISTDTAGQPGNTQTTPGQPGNTETAGNTDTAGQPISTGQPGNTDTTPGQPGNTDTAGQPISTDSAGQPITTNTAGQPGNTETPGQPGNTDTAGQPISTDSAGQPISTDSAGQPISTGQPGNTDTTPGQPGNTDTAGQPISTDSAGQPITTNTAGNTETAGQPISTDSAGQPISTDSAGQPITTNTAGQPGNTETPGQPGNTDTTGQPISTDSAGQPISTDSAGQPITTNTDGGNTDTAGQPISTDSAGQPISTDTTGQPGNTETTNTEATNTDTTGQPISTDSAGQPISTDTAGQPGNTETTNTDATNTDTAGQPGNTETGGNTGTNGASTTGAGASETTGAGASETGPGATITSAPVTSTTAGGGGAITSTMTEPPADWSPTTVSDHPEWTTNTWITTTSEGSDEPTIVPVLIGCPVCGGGGGGIILFGFPKFINTLFKFPNFPQFSFPCIPPGCDSPPETHEDDGDDSSSTDEASETTTAASSTCTEQITASDCLVACTTYTGPGADPTPDCSTTCTRTQTGCDVTGVTSTTSAEACSATGDDSCLNCAEEENLVDWEADPEDAEFQKRSEYSPSLRGHPSLEKRSPAAVVTKLGDPATGCSFTKLVQYPEYPGGGELMKPDLLGTLGTVNPDWDSKIKRWFIMTRDAQCIPSLSQVTASGYHAKGSNGRWVQKDLPTTDHFYEKSWLKDFFVNILDSNAADLSTLTGEQTTINCKDFNYYTDETAAASVPNQLAQVFNAYPSRTDYLENFIGMDDYINAQCKGVVATPETVRTGTATQMDAANDVLTSTPWSAAAKRIENKLQWLERLALGIEMINDPDGIQDIIEQNQRIYSRLVNIDNSAINCKKDASVIDGKWSFATRYQTFMEKRFDGTETWSINYAVDNAKTQLLAKLNTDLTNAKLPNSPSSADTKKLADFNARYTKLTTATYAVTTVNWVWTYTTARDVDDGSSCPINTVSQTLSTFSTSIISQSQSETIVSTTEAPPTTTQPPPTTTEVAEPTTTSEAPPPETTTAAPVTPLARGGIQCHNEDDFPDHKDVSPDKQDEYSTDFSGLSGPNGNDNLYDGAGSVTLHESSKSVNYDYSVEWVPGCVTTVDEQNFRFPLGNGGIITAYLIVREAYTKCNNGGVGGKEQVGCLLYEFTGAGN